MKFIILCVCVIGSAFFHCQNTRAQIVKIKESLRAVPITLSGTLTPLSIAVNGQPLKLDNEVKVTQLYFNGDLVPTHQDSVQSFYFTSDSSQVDFQGLNENNLKTELFHFTLPELKSVQVAEGQVNFELKGEITSFTLDGKEISKKESKSESGFWPIPTDSSWIDRPHVLELQAKTGEGRIYNLNFSEWRSQLLKEKIVSVGIGGPPQAKFDPSGIPLAAHFWSSYESRWVWGVGFYFSSGTKNEQSTVATSTDSTTIEAFEIRVGYYPFLAGQSWFDFKRLIVGLGCAFEHQAETNSGTSFQNGQSGPFTQSLIQNSFIGSVFVREEAFRYQDYGISFTLEHDFYSPDDTNGGKMAAALEFAYHW